MFRFLLTAALVLGVCVEADDMVDTAKLDAIFSDWSEPGSPGGAVAVIRDGEVIATRGYGLAQLEYDIPVTDDTIFHVASVSKQFTAFAVILLAGEGKLGLDDEIQDHLPWVNHFEHPVTIRHLMNHTSGIRDQWELLALAGWRLDDVITTEDIRRLMKKQVELNFEPGSEYMYSNMGYTLLAEIVEAVSDQPFVDFTRERIFEPLGMTRTHFHDDHQRVVRERAYSYFSDDGTWKNSVLSYANAGATSLFTTARDLLLWLDNYRTLEVGSENARREMIKVPRIGDRAGGGSGYASGLSVDRYRGEAIWSHSGGDAGFRSFVSWFPEANVGISVVSNVAATNAGGLASEVADLVLADRLEPRDEPVSEGPSDPEASAVELPAEILERYSGRLRFEDGIGIDVELHDGNLVDSFGNTWMATGETSFLIPGLGVDVNFVVDGDTVTAVSYTQGENTVQGRKVAAEPLGADAEKLVGWYLSPELDRLIAVAIADGELVLRHPRHGDLVFTKEAGDDVFRGASFFANALAFEYDDEGAATALLVSGGRNRNHRFNRVDLP